jgi:two-component system, NtrC family, nitrogen regulation response regulator NtrX
MKNARILVVDDESDIRALVAEILTEEGCSVTMAADAAEARAARRESEFDLILLDIWMPDIDGITLLKEWNETGLASRVVMMSGHGTVDTAVEATRLGAVDFIEKPVSLSKLLRTIEKALSLRRGPAGAAGSFMANAPVGKSEAMRALRDQIARVAHHDAHTMFCGEPGAGKELAARYLATQSRRADGPLITAQGAELDAANAAPKLLGTDTNVGLLRNAAGGVLILNDLAELSPEGRRILLHVLREGRIGTSANGEQYPLDVRILSCAPPGFERNEVFGADLLARLSVVVIRVPPLREYVEDVPELLRYYVDVLVDSEALPFRRFSVAAQNRLRNYPWPGNVRELKNLVRRLLILGGPEEISLAEVEAQVDVSSPGDEPLVKQDLLAMPLREAREHFERAYLQQQLQLCEGKVGQLAKRVGMERTHLYRKLRSLGVDFRQIAADD